MPKGVRLNRAALFKQLQTALDDVDAKKIALRKAKGRVSFLLDKLNQHVASARARKRRAAP